MAMTGADGGCGALYAFYVAAREGDVGRMAALRDPAVEGAEAIDGDVARRLAEASADDPETARTLAAELLFTSDEEPRLDGPVATAVGHLLYWFGFVASFVLFLGADSRTSVVRRLRWAYRAVGVDVRDVETADGVERTVFRCPYRNLGAGRYGRRRVCHDVLDKVDDGYVTFLGRHRGIDYDRPRACAASECCYSAVAER